MSAKKATEATKAKDTVAVRELNKKAKDINSTMDRAAKADQRADDLRLTAAQMIAECAKVCKEHKITFKQWCADNLTISHGEADKLLQIGRASDPAKALADHRARNADRNRKARAKAKASKSAGTRTADAGKQGQQPPKSPYALALASLDSLDAGERARVVQEKAASVGLAVLPAKHDARAYVDPRASVAALKKAFMALGSDEQAEFLKWANRECGHVLTEAAPKDTRDKSPADLTGDIPAHLKRERKAA